MSKKKKALIIVAILAIILLAFIGGQAYAKYITEVKGQGMAEVATWSFKVNGGKEQIQQINLASTCDNNTLVDNKIAPGTSGSFNIIIDGTGSDVGIRYNINFEDNSTKPTNLKFKYENVEYNSLGEIQDSISGIIGAKDENKVITLPIEWIWEYETGSNSETINANDTIDTEDAQNIQNYTFNVSVIGTQVEPQ